MTHPRPGRSIFIRWRHGGRHIDSHVNAGAGLSDVPVLRCRVCEREPAPSIGLRLQPRLNLLEMMAAVNRMKATPLLRR